MSENIILNVGGGGNGAALNFKVVGNPQPASPSENTIWVNTDTPITGYEFSATEPVEPIEGLVSIFTGTSSPVEFNALKKNGIHVYPASVKQYVGGAWVDKTAKSYQGGEWVEWFPAGALYYKGNQINGITGGWETRSIGAPTMVDPVFSSECIEISFERTRGTPHVGCVSGTKNAIDLTSVAALAANVTEFAGKSGYTRLGVYPSGQTASENLTSYAAINSTGVARLDVSKLSGLYYVVLGGYSKWGDDQNMNATVKVDEIKRV